MASSYEYEQVERIIPSMLALARCYQYGLGTEENHEKALELYKKAAEFGDVEAMFSAGRAIMLGVGVRAEYAAARTYILRAARKDYIPAMQMMGYFAENGKGVSKNKDDARHWYMRAISREISSRPSLYELNEHFAESVKQAMEARLESQYRLGMLLARRENASLNDYMQAFEYISLAASLGHTAAQTEITKIYINGGELKDYYESDFSREDAHFVDGSTHPDSKTISDAMNKLGDAMYGGSGSVTKNQSAAVKCYQIAANLGNNDAAYSYGWCLRHGVGIRENAKEAVKWLKLSADKGNANAAYSYGLCCEEGSGTDIKNKREALNYYRKAAASGHQDAAQRYVMLSERED